MVVHAASKIRKIVNKIPLINLRGSTNQEIKKANSDIVKRMEK